jgi:GNAT superfamily N-acetyltransferase
MDDMIEDFSQETLIKANEANLYGLTPFFYDFPGARKHPGPDVSWCVTDIGFPWCNTAFAARLEAGEAEAAIEAFVSEGDRRGVPLFWFLGHDTTPGNLGDYLAARGFGRWGDSTGMAADLHALKRAGTRPSGLEILRVEDTDTLATWCRVTAKGYGMPPQAAKALLKWFTIARDLGQPLQFYLALSDGRPVATSSLFFGGGVAGVYFVATIPEARGQGIGFTVTFEPLLEAKEMGYRAAVLQASKMGEGVYRKMGFREFCKMNSYIRFNEGPGPSA